MLRRATPVEAELRFWRALGLCQTYARFSASLAGLSRGQGGSRALRDALSAP